MVEKGPLAPDAGADEAKVLEDLPDLNAEDIRACLTYAAAKVDAGITPRL